MNRALLPTVVCLASLLAMDAAMGNPVTTQSQTQDTQSAPLGRSDSEQAASWGLTGQEWTRFEQIQSGPRGFWSPNLDPLTALGVEAQTDQERQRYAELQVALEAKRAERELAYQNAYAAAWTKLFPGLLPIQGMASRPLSAQRPRRARLYLWRTTAQRVPPKPSVCKAATRRSISTWWAAKARMNASVAGLGKRASIPSRFNAGRSP